MSLYTIVSLEDIFYQAPPHRHFRQEGERFFEEQNGQICRLISTNPADYLNSGYLPGSPGIADSQ